MIGVGDDGSIFVTVEQSARRLRTRFHPFVVPLFATGRRMSCEERRRCGSVGGILFRVSSLYSLALFLAR